MTPRYETVSWKILQRSENIGTLMDPRTLANLRRKQLYIHKQLNRLEPSVAALRASLAETDARIQAECPDLNLPPGFHKPNPVFGIGKLPRLVREIMRDAGGPISTRDIAVKALARKGVTLPGPGDEADQDADTADIRGLGGGKG
jgi:hypothetical protein